jgi:hypothetical protein
MPLVRIDLRKGKDTVYRQDIGRAVYEALVSVGVPKDDRFQVVGEYEADDFLFDPDYLGIHRSDDLVMIQRSTRPSLMAWRQSQACGRRMSSSTSSR